MGKIGSERYDPHMAAKCMKNTVERVLLACVIGTLLSEILRMNATVYVFDVALATSGLGFG